MSNLHLALAIEKGVDHEFSEKAAFLCSIQVDFAKHGRCIKLEAMNNLSKENKTKPPFLRAEDPFEQDFVDIGGQCNHIIQKLYDQVNIS
jgi:hypothetical protein